VKSARWKKAGIILVVLATVLIAASLIIPKLIDLDRYNRLVASQLEKALGGEVVLGHLEWGLIGGIWLKADGLSIQGATALPADLTVSGLHATVSLLPLLSKRVVVEELVFERPFAVVRLLPSPEEEQEAASEPATLPPPLTESKEASPLPVEIFIERLILREGRIRLENSLTSPGEPIVQHFTDVSIEGFDLALGKELAFELALRHESEPGLGSLEGRVTFDGLTETFAIQDPKLNVKAILTEVDVAILGPYLKNEALSERMGGTLSLEVDYQGDLGQHFRVGGHIDLSGFAYRDPSLWDNPLPGAKTTLAYEAVFDPEEIRIEELQLNLGNLSLSLQALVRDWREEPVVRDALFSSELPLVELIPLIPWTKVGEGEYVIRKSLAGGGKVVVERVEIPNLPLRQIPGRWEELLSTATGSIEIIDMSAKVSPLLPRAEHITGRLRLEEGVLRATDLLAQFGPLTLPSLDLKATDLTGKPKVSAVARGPMRLAGSSDAQVKKLLTEYGLERLTGTAETDISAHYDHAKPKDWDVHVDLVLEGVRVDTIPGDMSFTDLQGRVTLQRKKNMEITVQNLKGRMNQSPIHLNGRVAGIESDRFVVDARVRTEDLDLTPVSALVPSLKNLELEGRLGLNLNVHYPNTDPLATRLTGTVKARGLGLQLDAQSIRVKDGDAALELAGSTLRLEHMRLLANDQELALSGQATDWHEPRVQMHISCPYLNMDRLLPPVLDLQPSLEPKGKQGDNAQRVSAQEGEGERPALPPVLLKITAQLQADVRRGEYRGQTFQDLKFQGTYERGLLKSHAFDVGIADGHFGTRGSADFRDLDRIPFSVEPDVRGVPTESIGTLVGMDEVSFEGPVTITGQIQGRTGSAEELLESLQGELEGQTGPGKILGIGQFGSTLFKMLALINFTDMVQRKSMVDLRTDGLPYDSIHATTSFKDGNMNVSALHLKGPSLEMESTSEVDLVGRQLRGSAKVTVLGSVDKGLGYVPLVGDTAANVMKTYVNIRGPWENPSIVPDPGKKAIDAAGGVVGTPGRAGKGVLKGVRKGLDKVFKK
jgi:uncharacterized protein YhdP